VFSIYQLKSKVFICQDLQKEIVDFLGNVIYNLKLIIGKGVSGYA